MGDVILINGAQLQVMQEMFARMGEADVYSLRVCIDEGGVKFKANNWTWTPPYGEVETE